MVPALTSISEYERWLRTLRCVVSTLTPVTLHHCHSGSMQELGWWVGKGQRQNPFLQLPLHERFHTGDRGIDSGMGVATWEGYYGTQAQHLETIDSLWRTEAIARPSIWVLANEWEKVNRGKSA